MVHVKLNSDIIRQIILSLADSDPKTGEYKSYSILYPCLLVNREWCRITVPILWQQPFSFDHIRGARAIVTYCRFLSFHEKQILIENGININLLFQNGSKSQYEEEEDNNNNLNSLNRGNVMSLEFITNSSNSSSSSSSSSSSFYNYDLSGFNYPLYLRRLHYENFFKSAEYICIRLSDYSEGDLSAGEDEYNEEYYDDEDQRDFSEQAKLLVNSLLTLSQKNGARLNGLWFSPDSPYNDIDKYEPLYEYGKLLEDVNVLDICCLFRKPALFSILGRMCHQVRHLRIHMIWSRHYEEKHIDKTGEVIHELISSQKSLVSFHLESCKAYTRIFFPLLSIHSRSLRHLKFDQVDFRGCPSWAPISDCANLQLLEIIQCTNMEPDMVRPLISNNNTPGEKFKVKYIKINHSCRELEEWVKRVNGYKQIDLPIDIQKLDEASGSNNRTKEI